MFILRKITEELIKTFIRREKEMMSYFYFYSNGQNVPNFEKLYKYIFEYEITK